MSRFRFLSALTALALSAAACASAGIDPAHFAPGDASWASSSASGVPASSLAAGEPDGGAASAGTYETARSPRAQASTPLSVTIYGTPTAEAGDFECYYWAVAEGGTGSGYTYNWSGSGGSGTGNGDSWTGGSYGDFTLYVTVTDSGSAQANDSFFVDVVQPGGSSLSCFH